MSAAPSTMAASGQGGLLASRRFLKLWNRSSCDGWEVTPNGRINQVFTPDGSGLWLLPDVHPAATTELPPMWGHAP